MEAISFQGASSNGHHEIKEHRIDPHSSANLYAKMARVMAELGDISATGEAHFTGKNKPAKEYATIHDVTTAIRALMGKHGIAFFADMTDITDMGTVYRVTFTFTFACGESGMVQTSRWSSEVTHTFVTSYGGKEERKYNDKALNAASTHAAKYFLLRTFVATYSGEKDPDENENPPSAGVRPQSSNASDPRHKIQTNTRRRIEHWTADKNGRAANFIEHARLAGLGEDNATIWKTLSAYYTPGKTLERMSDIQDSYGDAIKRVDAIAAELKAPQSEPAAGQSDDPAKPYHETLTTAQLQHLWDMADSMVGGTDADVATALQSTGMPVDTDEQRAAIMRDFLEMSLVGNEKQAHEALASLPKA